jgi:hypothetical protein
MQRLSFPMSSRAADSPRRVGRGMTSVCSLQNRRVKPQTNFHWKHSPSSLSLGVKPRWLLIIDPERALKNASVQQRLFIQPLPFPLSSRAADSPRRVGREMTSLCPLQNRGVKPKGAPGLAFETWDPSNQFPLETLTLFFVLGAKPR